MDKKNKIASNCKLYNYLEEIGVQNLRLDQIYSISESFYNLGIESFWGAIEYVHQLPYGRTTDRSDLQQVLTEQRGTCSSKHALLATLAEELNIPLKLTLGCFLFTKETTPSLAPILKKYKINTIIDAHCYLKYENNFLDITFPDSNLFNPSLKALQEESINPQQIGEYKVECHQSFIFDWVEKDISAFQKLWNAREEWIASLTNSNFT